MNWFAAFVGLYIIGFFPMYMWRSHSSLLEIDGWDIALILIWPLTVIIVPLRAMYLITSKSPPK